MRGMPAVADSYADKGRAMAEALQATDEPSLAFACRWCGRAVTLVPGPTGVEIPDLASFLRDHGKCLRRADEALDHVPDPRTP